MRDVTDDKIDLTDGKRLEIQVTSSGKQYHDSFELFEEIDVQVGTDHLLEIYS